MDKFEESKLQASILYLYDIGRTQTLCRKSYLNSEQRSSLLEFVDGLDVKGLKLAELGPQAGLVLVATLELNNRKLKHF